MARYRAVVGLTPRTYTEDDLVRFARWRSMESPWIQKVMANQDRKLLGKTFVFEQLDCGCLGECLGVEGQPDVKDPAKRRMCTAHSYEDEDE